MEKVVSTAAGTSQTPSKGGSSHTFYVICSWHSRAGTGTAQSLLTRSRRPEDASYRTDSRWWGWQKWAPAVWPS